jgi:hypothetical protein
MQDIRTLDLDIAKSVFQMHGIDDEWESDVSFLAPGEQAKMTRKV